jgi:hypothetical protein
MATQLQIGVAGLVYCVLIVLFPVISTFVHRDKSNVFTFSLHPYESLPSSFAGPFLGKIRVGNSSHILMAPTALSQSQCNQVHDTEKEKCLMQNSPNLYLGKVHSSWSVLGAQSRFLQLKNILVLTIVLTVFGFSQQMMRLFFRERQTMIQHAVVVVSIIVLSLSIGFDIKDKMHDVDDNYNHDVAIGSITTGASYSFLSLLIISASHVDKIKEYVPGSRLANWNQHLHYNIYASYMILFLVPLYALLALSRSGSAVVDVHVQLIFCGCVFYAVLDVIQTRVSSVLAGMHDEIVKPNQEGGENNQDAEAANTNNEQKHIQHQDLRHQYTFMRFFVVLAFVLTKLFVFVPCVQVISLFYTANDANTGSVAFAYVLVILSAVYDLLYAVWFSRIHATWYNIGHAAWYAIGRNVLLLAFAVGFGIIAIS